MSSNVSQIYPYVEWFRDDIISAVPSNAECVLSVGCGTGFTESELVKSGVKVIGIEIDHGAARIAKQRGLTILEGDASEVSVETNGKLFDCIIYADILEHLPDPVAVLKRHMKFLKSNGIVYISIPNFRHYSVFWELFVKGHVHYKDSGILDRTHLRITTRRMVQEWFEQAGLKLVSQKYIKIGRKANLLAALFLWLAQEFTSIQVGLTARKNDIM